MKKLGKSSVTFFFCLASLASTTAAETEDTGVLYLNKFEHAPLRLKVLQDTQLNMTQAPKTYLTILPKGQTVEVLAIAQYQLLVRGKMSTGTVQGWVNRDDITPIAENIISELKEKEKAKSELDTAIKRKEVILGMSQDQVKLILGKPEDKTSIREKDEVIEIWTYYTYKKVPVAETFGYGTNILTRYYTRKLRAGSKVIQFKDGIVTRTEEKSEDTSIQNPVPPPFYLPQ